MLDKNVDTKKAHPTTDVLLIVSNTWTQRLHLPGVAAVEQVVNAFVFAVGLLLVHLVFVQLGVGGLLHVADDAECHGQVAVHVGQHHVDAGILGGFVVNHDVVYRDSVLADGDHFELASVEAEAFLLVLAEEHGLAVLEHDGAVVTYGAVGDGSMCLIIEYHAVLQHLDNRSAVMLCGAGHDVGGQSRHTVECTGEECALCAHDQLTRVERIVDGAEGRSLGHLAKLGGWAVLAFRQAVNLVVEDGDVEVLVTAHGMDEVVATDGHRVTVAHVHPHRKGGVGELHAGSDGTGTSVDAVETIGVNIIRYARRASDTRHHADVLLLVTCLGEGVEEG